MAEKIEWADRPMWIRLVLMGTCVSSRRGATLWTKGYLIAAFLIPLLAFAVKGDTTGRIALAAILAVLISLPLLFGAALMRLTIEYLDDHRGWPESV